jgi:hypothetical protein
MKVCPMVLKLFHVNKATCGPRELNRSSAKFSTLLRTDYGHLTSRPEKKRNREKRMNLALRKGVYACEYNNVIYSIIMKLFVQFIHIYIRYQG